MTKDIWNERFKDIRAFERYLARNGTLILKFFLHVSKEEQKRRFLERIDEPSKNWKFSMGDVEERKLWDKYMRAYEDMIRHTATKDSPWYVVPADNKWFTRAVVAAAVVDAGLAGPPVPKVDKEKRAATWKRPGKCCAKSADSAPAAALAHGPTRSWRASPFNLVT